MPICWNAVWGRGIRGRRWKKERRRKRRRRPILQSVSDLTLVSFKNSRTTSAKAPAPCRLPWLFWRCSQSLSCPLVLLHEASLTLFHSMWILRFHTMYSLIHPLFVVFAPPQGPGRQERCCRLLAFWLQFFGYDTGLFYLYSVSIINASNIVLSPSRNCCSLYVKSVMFSGCISQALRMQADDRRAVTDQHSIAEPTACDPVVCL